MEESRVLAYMHIYGGPIEAQVVPEFVLLSSAKELRFPTPGKRRKYRKRK